jgi:hypothetical protein
VFLFLSICISKNEKQEKVGFAPKNLPGLPAAFFVAEKMGKELGSGKILFRKVP